MARSNKAKKKATRKNKTINLNQNLDNINDENRIKQNFRSIGKSGTFVSANKVIEDNISTLDGTSGQAVWAKMLRHDSQVRKIYHAVNNPIKSAKWSIEPASMDPIDVEKAALIEKILFKDIPGGWRSKLDEILTYPFHGHAVFEVIFKNFTDLNFGPYTGISNIAFRDQRTLEEFKFDRETGAITEIRQKQSGDLDVDAWIPAENLMIFFNERKGSDLGYPFCRMLYGPYKRKLLAKELQIIGVERSAIPVPHLKLPEAVRLDSDEAIAAQAQLEAFTNAETAYFITPHGWDLEYHATNTFDPSKVQTVIKSENEEMAGSIVAMFLEMGIGGNSGNQAGVEGSINFFNKGLAHIADNISDVFNSSLIPCLIDLNFGEQNGAYPELVHSGVNEDAGTELMTIITGYVEKAIITPDEQLEDFVRKKHNLPKKAEGEVIDNGGTVAEVSEPTVTEPVISNPTDEVELAEKVAGPRALISSSAVRVSNTIRENIRFTADKLINDIMKKYRTLPPKKKQNAVKNLKVGGQAIMRKALKQDLTDIFAQGLDQAKKEVPVSGEVKLNEKSEMFLDRLTTKYGEHEIKLNEFSSLPAHAQVLIGIQSELITKDTIEDLENQVAFTFSSTELNTDSEAAIQQALEDSADKYIESNNVNTKGVNVSSTMVNESRDTWFFAPEVVDEIHSFTFVNPAPKSAVCIELAGTTFRTNDIGSIAFTPPLHHNCKSILRANLKTSRGVDRLEISTLSPSANAKKSITL